jgi:hypothetical protein
MKKNNKQTNIQDLEVLTFAGMQALVNAPIPCPVKWGDKMLKLELVAMMDGVKERVLAIRRGVQPPFKKDRGTNGDYDMMDPKYIEARDNAARKSRCVVVYFCWPELGRQKTCVTDDEIVKFVSESVPPPVQELIAVKAEMAGLNIAESVNFTSPDGLES